MDRPTQCEMCGKENDLRPYGRPNGFSGWRVRWWCLSCFDDAYAQDPAWRLSLDFERTERPERCQLCDQPQDLRKYERPQSWSSTREAWLCASCFQVVRAAYPVWQLAL